MSIKKIALCIMCIYVIPAAWAAKIFIPMDAEGQSNHLKAYGIAFAALTKGIQVDWLLNYKGGSFGMEYDKDITLLCTQRGVNFVKMKDREYADITKEVGGLKYNGDVVVLEKVPRIAVYTPLNKEPWDDAVTLALTYADIPFDKLYANEVLDNGLKKYDWLHLHHEDFTGQLGKFWSAYRNAEWYQNDERAIAEMARKHGYKKISQMQLAVVKKIKDFVGAGGNLFAMCSATDTYDIALAADSMDICETQFDGDPIDPDAQAKLNFDNCFAFMGFKISVNPYEYAKSNIDNTNFRKITKESDVFTLKDYPAKYETVPAMLCQNHTDVVKGFMGQTTAFRNEVIKKDVLVMGECKPLNEARYIHGNYRKGSWTFYAGHDPEDYQHMVGAPPTNLNYYHNSPGYRLILNNVLFPAAKKKNMPTVVYSEENANKNPSATVEKKTAEKVNIQPNLSDNELVISYALPGHKIETVVLVNADGKEISRQKFNDEKVHVDLKNLAAGVYSVQVNGVYAGRVVKD